MESLGVLAGPGCVFPHQHSPSWRSLRRNTRRIHCHSENAVAKTDLGRDRARQRVADTMQTVTAQWPDTGRVDDLARLFREDPHQAEIDLRDVAAGAGS